MAHGSHILVVEDDAEIAQLVCRFLSNNRIHAVSAGNGREADKILRRDAVDLVILDIELPGEDGLSICSRLRARSPKLPIIMLTAKDEDDDRIAGLEMGADDYLAKPFNPRELLARIRAVLRRGGAGGNHTEAGMVLTFNGWRLDLNKGQLYDQAGDGIILTGAEFNLLRVFCQRPLQALSRDQLLQLTQGRNANLYERTIDILVSRLRHKLEADPKKPELIKTVRSAGYKFTASVERI